MNGSIIPLLTLNGQAAEALAFYSKAFNGQVVYQQTYGESEAADQTPAEWKDKIAQGAFQSGYIQFMVADTYSADHKVIPGDHISLSLNLEKKEDVEPVFAALSNGGEVGMPLTNTSWDAVYGVVTDPFGFNWMLNYHPSPIEGKEK